MTALVDLPHAAWVQQLGWTLVQFLWQGTLIAAIFAAVRGLIRRRATAEVRYLLACGTLGVMTLAPVLTFLVRVGVPLPPAWSVPSPDVWHTVLPWLVATWLTGVVFGAARFIGQWHATRRLRSLGVRGAPLEWCRRLADLGRRLGIVRPVRLVVSSLVEFPIVLGWWRPIILVPIGALTGLPASQVEALLAHELAHIRRLDYLVNILQGVVETVLFYHPAVWWVSREIRTERELCCDDLAVAVSGDVLIYAQALTELESHRPSHTRAVAATGGSLFDRIGRLLGQAPPVSHALPAPGVAGTMTLLWLVGLGAVGTHAAPGPGGFALGVAREGIAAPATIAT
ncbi:MAG TPA: M56 family metallopeptidase, partial [Vicinamibacterales bacterium]